jgi:CRP-like cAMP-binding protein
MQSASRNPGVTPLPEQVRGPRGINNRLLLSLPPASLDKILRISQPVSLVRRQRLSQVDDATKYVYFVNRGLVSIVKTMEDGRTIEIGAVGLAGMTSPLSLLGIDKELLDLIVQIPGTALRIGRDALLHEVENDDSIRHLLQHHLRLTASELARTAACGRLHHLEQRCCLWLLLAHDSAMSDEFPLTHEFLAMMLGYQRAGVSIAMSAFAKAGFIEHKRSHVMIKNRAGLEASACECYRSMQSELDEILPPAKSAKVFGFIQSRSSGRV